MITFRSFALFTIAAAAIGLGISYSVVYLYHVALLGLTFTYAYKKHSILRSEIRLPTRYHYITYFLFLYYLVSMLWSWNSGDSIQYLFYIICGSSILLLMVYTSKTAADQGSVFRLLVIIFAIDILVSLLEAFTPFRMPISPYSPYAKLFGRTERNFAILDPVQALVLRSSPTGFQWNPNDLAVAILIAMPFFLTAKKKWLKILGMAATLVIIIMTRSRGVFIAYCVVVAVYFWLAHRRLAVLMICLLSLAIMFSGDLIELAKSSPNAWIADMADSVDTLARYFSTQRTTGESIGIRQTLIRNGLDAFLQTNGVGVGGGASKAVQESRHNTYGITSMHNFWIELLVEGGIPVFAVFCLWYGALLVRLRKTSVRTNDPRLRYYAKSTFLALIGFSIGCVSSSSVIYFFPMWLLYGFAIATLNNATRDRAASLAKG